MSPGANATFTLQANPGAVPITTTFTWVPDAGQTSITDPPPNCVLVEQDAGVRWYLRDLGGTATCDGTLDPGVPGATPVTGDFWGSSPDSPGMVSSATSYTVKYSPGSSFSVSCKPTGSCTGQAGTNGSVDGEIELSCGASAYPITINLSGGIGSNTAKHLLIGQQLTATLTTWPLAPTSYYWGISGGVAFKNYTADDSSGVYTPLGYETDSQLVTYFCQPTTMATVSCLVHLAVPAGASPASGLDVTPTQTLTVEKPSALLDVAIGSVTDLPTSTNPIGVQLQQFYMYPQSGNAEGISWNGTLTTPAAYVTDGDYGSWNWTQLITAQRQQKNNGVYWQFAVNTTTPATVINNVSVLDGSYPYGYFWYPSDGTRTGNADSPYQPLDSSIAIREYDVSDSFNDYLMYLPPGSGSLPVAMKRSSWYWDFQALKDPTNAWSTSGENAQWGFVGDFPAFPTWTFNAAIGALTYVAP